jgi:tryptophan 2,3-dioxygenase
MSSQPLSYESYLRVPDLLRLQKPLSDPEAHDELQFIVVHQVYELWFKLLLHEVRSVIEHLHQSRVGPSLWLVRRCIEIARVLIQQIHVMETMSPADFLEFRDVLKPASGLQSAQFRVLEFLSNLKNESYLKLYPGSPEALAELKAALDAPSLWDGFLSLLQKRGFIVDSHETQLQALVTIYTNDEHLDLHQLAEGFIEYDEAFRIWRTRHYLMAERMIGFKPGTGVQHTEAMKPSVEKPSGGCPFSGGLPRGEGDPSFQDPGVHYLRGRADLRYFPALWEVRSRIGSGYGA